MAFKSEFLKKQSFDQVSLKKYLAKAKSNFYIALSSKTPEVKFHFSYLALIQIGITLIATKNYRIKSKDGHHIMIIESLAELLGENDINVIGGRMRQKRNADIYGELTTITTKEAKQYQDFVEKVLKKCEEYISKQKHLL
jgi:hypothetical protein